MRSHEYKLLMQARYMRMHERRQIVFFDIFDHLLIKTHPKYVPTPPKVSGFHLNPSYNKTQAFTCPKKKKKWKIRAKLKNEKSLKNLPIQHLHSLKDDLVACRSVEETRLALQPHSSG